MSVTKRTFFLPMKDYVHAMEQLTFQIWLKVLKDYNILEHKMTCQSQKIILLDFLMKV